MTGETVQRLGIAVILTGGFLDVQSTVETGYGSAYALLVVLGLGLVMLGAVVSLATYTPSRRESGGTAIEE
ncbi:hypothetical protein [Salinilacihabitans rarus]|uniref:hypothetical protein n=1 Tax=Salinilacihabitans rarus TaxID=2961596 RepID=UPI0020C901CD|nr:hypothetical protein [Salinilacihabitans rarus]